MLIELAILGGAVALGRALARRPRRLRPGPTVLDEADAPPEPPRWIDDDVAAGGGALALAGAGWVARSTTLGLVSVPLTLWSSRSQFRDAHRSLLVEKRLSFAVVESGLTVVGFATGAFVFAAGNAALHVVSRKLAARTAAQRGRGPLARVARPEGVWQVVDGGVVEVPTAALGPGDTIALGPGDRITVDGCVVGGAAHVDGRRLDGRLAAFDVEPGGRVAAGQRVRAGRATVRVERRAETRRARLESSRPRREVLEDVSQRADLVADASVGFTLPIAAVAGVVGGAPMVLAVLTGNLVGAYRVVGPLGLELNLRALGAHGVHIADGRAFELLAGVDRLCVDLGAVLDPERLTLAEVIVRGVEPAAALGEAAALWRCAADGGGAMGAALIEALAEQGHPLPDLGRPTAEPDGVVTDTRRALGPAAALRRRGIPADPGFDRRRDPTHGQTTLTLAVDGREVALLVFEPTLRPGAAALFSALDALRVVPVLMCADAPEVAERWGRRLGVRDAWGGLDADERALLVEAMRAGGHLVGYLGAELVDLPAMASADVALATWPSDPAVCAAAHVVVGGMPVGRLPALIEAARRYHRGQGHAIGFMIGGTGALGFATLAFGLGPLTALMMQVASIATSSTLTLPDVGRLVPLPAIEPRAAPGPHMALAEGSSA